MAKEIKFNIKLLIDGKEQLVTASTSAKSCSVGALETSAPPKSATVRVRRPIGFRSPSNRFPSAV